MGNRTKNLAQSENGRHVIMYFSRPANYIDDVVLLCLSRSRKFKLGTAAEFITTAYLSFDPDYPIEFLDLLEEENTCRRLLEVYKIKHKDTTQIYLDHPDYLKKPVQAEITSWKRIVFDEESTDQLRTYEWISEFAPRDRIEPVLRILRQYLVLTGNKYYYEQRALRLMTALLTLNTGNKNDREKLRCLIDMIWKIGTDTDQKQP